MPSRDTVLTPEVVRILKIFFFSSFGLMLVFSFFNSHRADNSGKELSTFRITDADKLYFLNVRSIYYDRELRRDADMTLFRHGKRIQSGNLPRLDPVIILNPGNDEAYIYFELSNSEFPVQIRAKSGKEIQTLEILLGNNSDHYQLMKNIKPLIDNDFEIHLIKSDLEIALWSSEKEKEILKTVFEDYFRLLNQSDK
jgi:hypothetical protein